MQQGAQLMTFYIVSALIILAVGIYSAYKNIDNLKTTSVKMTAAISLAVSVLVIPYYMKNQYDFLIVILKSIRYGVSAVTMSVNTDVVETLELTEPVRTIYKGLLYGLYILGPIFASLTVMSFSRTIMEWFGNLRSRRIHVFTQISQETLLIAESLSEKKKEMILLYNADAIHDESMTVKANSIHAMFMNKDANDIRFRKDAFYEFYVINEDPEKVLAQMEKLCDLLLKKPNFSKDYVIVRCFIDRTEMELIRYLDRKYGNQITIRYMDPANAAAVDVLRRRKESLLRQPHNEVFIFGAHNVGMSLLRNLSCLLIQPGYTWDIHVFDKEAVSIAGELKAKCPEYLNLNAENYLKIENIPGMNYNVHFHPYDRNILLPAGLSGYPQPDHIFICEDDDKLNYKIAKTIKRYYAALNQDLSFPDICVLIRSPQLNKIIIEPDMTFFGNSEKLYNYKTIVTPELEEGARRTHLAYLMDPKIMNASRQEQNRVLDETGYYSFANMDSSFSMALALEYRIAYILSQKTGEGSDTEYIRAWLSDEDNLQKLADAEHLRWNCAQRLLGYRLPTADQERLIAERLKGKKVKDDELLMHPALVDNEHLADAEQLADQILGSLNPEAKKTNYTALDKAILLNMIEITGFDKA